MYCHGRRSKLYTQRTQYHHDSDATLTAAAHTPKSLKYPHNATNPTNRLNAQYPTETIPSTSPPP